MHLESAAQRRSGSCARLAEVFRAMIRMWMPLKVQRMHGASQGRSDTIGLACRISLSSFYTRQFVFPF